MRESRAERLPDQGSSCQRVRAAKRQVGKGIAALTDRRSARSEMTSTCSSPERAPNRFRRAQSGPASCSSITGAQWTSSNKAAKQAIQMQASVTTRNARLGWSSSAVPGEYAKKILMLLPPLLRSTVGYWNEERR